MCRAAAGKSQDEERLFGKGRLRDLPAVAYLLCEAQGAGEEY